MDQPDNNEKLILRLTEYSPFEWQEIKAMELIRNSFGNKKRDKAVVIYVALTECASEEGKKLRRQTASFIASLPRIAKKARCSVSTIKRYAQDFKKIGLLIWQCRRRGKFNVSNNWKLLCCPAQHGEGISPHYTELAKRAHFTELEKEERVRKYITKKRENYNFGTNEGFKPIKDLI